MNNLKELGKLAEMWIDQNISKHIVRSYALTFLDNESQKKTKKQISSECIRSFLKKKKGVSISKGGLWQNIRILSEAGLVKTQIIPTTTARVQFIAITDRGSMVANI